MMQRIYMILILFICYYSNAQSQTLNDKISKDVCYCLDTESDSTINQSFMICYKTAINNYQDELMKHIDFESDKSAGEQGLELGSKIMLNVIENLIYQCDDYYYWFEHRKEKIFAVSDTNQLINDIDDFSNKLAIDSKNEMLLARRGYSFLKLKDYKNSIKDFKSIIKNNPSNSVAMLYLGLNYEYKDDYKKALKYYAKAYDLTQKQELLIYRYSVLKKLNYLQ